MRSLIFSLFLLCCISNGFSQENKKVIARIISSEISNINGAFSFNMKYVFQDTVSFSNYSEFDLPSGWSASMNPALTGNTFNKRDSVTTTVTINYPVNNLLQIFRIFYYVKNDHC